METQSVWKRFSFQIMHLGPTWSWFPPPLFSNLNLRTQTFTSVMSRFFIRWCNVIICTLIISFSSFFFLEGVLIKGQKFQKLQGLLPKSLVSLARVFFLCIFSYDHKVRQTKFILKFKISIWNSHSLLSVTSERFKLTYSVNVLNFKPIMTPKSY